MSRCHLSGKHDSRTVVVTLFIDLAVEAFFPNGAVCRAPLRNAYIRASLVEVGVEGLELYWVNVPLASPLSPPWGPLRYAHRAGRTCEGG